MKSVTIDAVDHRILEALRDNARITNSRLAELVSLSPSACLARHKRLEKLGVIRGYRAEIALELIRPNIRVMIEMRLARHSTDDFRHLEMILKEDSRVLEAAEISGKMDYYASLCLTDMNELRDFIDDLTDKAPVIESVNSFVILHIAKNLTGPPLQ